MDPNIQTENQNPFPAQPTRSSGNIGGLVAAVIIVVMLAAGGYYFLYMQQNQVEPTPEQANGQDSASKQEDSLDSIGSDLEATQTTGAEADVAELESAL